MNLPIDEENVQVEEKVVPEGVTEESTSNEEATEATGEGASSENSHMKWYAVNTYSGHENKARLSLLERVKNNNLDDQFGEVLIPTEQVVEMVKGKKRTMTRKFYPGYMFVQMVMSDITLSLVKNTPKITGFLGGKNPVPVKDKEIAGISKQMTEGAAKPKPIITFEEGETVRVTTGPFANFNGVVEEVKPDKQKIRVLVSIFGRATPIELDFTQVDKA